MNNYVNPPVANSYTVATRPDPAGGPQLIYVSDLNGIGGLQFSTGIAWKTLRISDETQASRIANGVCLIGDSTAAQQTLGSPYNFMNFDFKGSFHCMNAQLGSPFTLLGNCGGSGQTSAQILARFGTGVASINGTSISTFTSGGSGHTVGDIVTMQNGMTVQVVTAGGGVVSAANILTTPTYPMANVPTYAQTQTSTSNSAGTGPGTGTGLAFSVQYMGDPLYFTNAGTFIIYAGTNDSGTIPAAQTIANLKSMYTQLRALNGAEVVFVTIAPNSSYGAMTTALGAKAFLHRNQVNQWMRAFAQQTVGVRVWDKARAVTDPATGTYIGYTPSVLTPVMSDDGVHDNYAGGMAVGTEGATTTFANYKLNNTGAATLGEIGYNGNPANAGSNATGTNGTILGAGVSGVAPDGYSIYQRGAASVITASIVSKAAPYSQERTINLAVVGTNNGDGVSLLFGGDNGGGATGRYDQPWVASTPYVTNKRAWPKGGIATAPFSGLMAVCIAGGSGSSGSTEPTWPTQAGQTIVDGTVTWQMVPQPTAYKWIASTYMGVGAVIKPTITSTYYLKCVIGGQTGSTEPAWSPIIGATVTDGGAVWSVISKIDYQYYAECDLIISGQTASKGVILSLALTLYDSPGGTAYVVPAVFGDLSASIAKPFNLPTTLHLVTPVLTMPRDILLRYFYANLSCSIDTGGSVNIQVSRAQIHPVALS